MVTEKDMERLYRYIPTLGVEKAIAEVAGEQYDPRTDSFVPHIDMQEALAERYCFEMREFSEKGGY